MFFFIRIMSLMFLAL